MFRTLSGKFFRRSRFHFFALWKNFSGGILFCLKCVPFFLSLSCIAIHAPSAILLIQKLRRIQGMSRTRMQKIPRQRHRMSERDWVQGFQFVQTAVWTMTVGREFYSNSKTFEDSFDYYFFSFGVNN